MAPIYATLTRQPLVWNAQTPASAYDLATSHGAGHEETLRALERAYQVGAGRAGRVVIAHDGYAPGTSEFHAGTATYRLTTEGI